MTIQALTIHVHGRSEPVRCEPGTRVGDLCPEDGGCTSKNDLPWLGALVSNDVCSMSYPLRVSANLRFLDALDRNGYRIYKRSLTFLLCKAIQECFPTAEFRIENAMRSAIYVSFKKDDAPDTPTGIQTDELDTLRSTLRATIDDDLPIQRLRLSFQEAYDLLQKHDCAEKLNLLRYRNPAQITVFACGEYWDLSHGVLAPSAGALPHWELYAYDEGLVIKFPVRRDGKLKMLPFEAQPHVHQIFREHSDWGKTVGVTFLGDLNRIAAERNLPELIMVSEAMHDKQLVRLADQIASQRETLKWIFIAGPSSAGKTTTSRRLAVHLKVNGLSPVTLECDNYFVNREDNPVGPDGKPDFEHIEAVDLPLLNAHLDALNAGRSIERPRFNFKTGEQEKSGVHLQLTENQVVILEGIHCLNPRLSEAIPDENKFRLYIGCMTQLGLDRTNRISTTDMRLIRRLVRDNRDRGHPALRTLELWPNVRKGEQRWIFPFQEHADATFNTSLDYELAVFKPFVRPLLAEVKPFHPEYAEARRILDLLELVVSGSAEPIPPRSLLREFLGGSIFAEAHG